MNKGLLYRCLAGLLLLCVVFDSGCWGRKFFKAPGHTIDTSAKVDSLLKENMVLQRRVYQVEQMLSNEQDYTRRVNAQRKMDLEELKDQVNTLTELASGSGGHPFTRETDDGPVETAASSPDSFPEPGDEATQPGDSLSGPVEAAPPRPEEIHRQIYLDFSRMEYEIALDESSNFLEEYPDHPLVEEVRYIRGECFMEQGKYFDALKEFSSVLQQYPRGRKTPSALLRMAISYDEIGDRDLAAGIVRRLVREYPGSEEAASARERFADLVNE